MAVNLVLATLTTALIVNTWLDRNGLFLPLLRWLQLRAEQLGFTALVARGALCRYCVSHWVGAAVALFLAPSWTLYLPFAAATIWLANHSISLYSLLAEHLTAKRQHIQLQQAQMQQLMRAVRQDTSAAA